MYAGPIYHASNARGPNESLISGGLKIVALDPGKLDKMLLSLSSEEGSQY